ncbi:MAG: ribonuclease Y [Chrysiogenetes bacterium]|nr:ribonuclease Y [Chrysiogenetes bacterium]
MDTNAIIFLVGGLAGGLGLGAALFLKRSKNALKEAERQAEELLDEAQEKARRIARNADKKAAQIRKDALRQSEEEAEDRLKEIAAKEQSLKARVKNIEDRSKEVDQTAAEIEKRAERIETERERREREIEEMRDRVTQQETSWNELVARARDQLERAAGLSAEDAKVELIKNIENDAKLEAARMCKQIEDEAKEKAEMQAKKIMATAIQRWAGDFTVERAVSVIQIPSDDIKGKIIGREGRNIRALQAATGMDFIIDDTPETIVISGFNPLRREIARVSLLRLIEDGRIHPARIEEIVGKVEKEVAREIKTVGEQAAMDVGIQDIHPEILKLIGTLKYRYSFAQNNLVHSLECAYFESIMADELGLDRMKARRCGLLHDIGKAVDHEVEGPHAYIGGDLARKYGEKNDVVVAVAGHHEDDPPSLWAALTQAADALSAARPGVRREMFENYVKRLEDLERIANAFPGVEQTYAIQAGRELRVIVSNDKLSDDAAYMLSKDIARKIEQDMTYPGQIKVTVLRETRAVDFAR